MAYFSLAAERPGQLLRTASANLDSRLEFDVDVGFRTLLLADGAVGARHAVVEHHHVVLDHAQPFRFRILARARRVFLALQLRALLHVGPRAVEPGLLVVPQHEADGALGLHVGLLNTRASSITSAVPEPSSLAASPQPMPSMCAPMMYISSGWVVPDLRAVHLFARAGHARL